MWKKRLGSNFTNNTDNCSSANLSWVLIFLFLDPTSHLLPCLYCKLWGLSQRRWLRRRQEAVTRAGGKDEPGSNGKASLGVREWVAVILVDAPAAKQPVFAGDPAPLTVQELLPASPVPCGSSVQDRDEYWHTVLIMATWECSQFSKII